MQTKNSIAFKEWAVVCNALGDGRQTLILRKGGIREDTGEFQLDHNEFWLFPTYEHQQSDDLIAEARPRLADVETNRPPRGFIHIGNYAVVQDVVEFGDSLILPTLTGLHIWSDQTVAKRFYYNRPSLYAITVRVYRVKEQFELPDSPHFAGCRSWVELPVELPTAGLEPVLSDAEFSRCRAAIEVATSPIRLA